MSSTTRIKITHARRHLCQVVRDIEEGRRPHVVITRGELPVVALVPCAPDGTPTATWSDDRVPLAPGVNAFELLQRELQRRRIKHKDPQTPEEWEELIAEENGGEPWPPRSEEAL